MRDGQGGGAGSPQPGTPTPDAGGWARWASLRFVGSWLIGIGLVVVVIPRTVNISWHGIWPVLTAVSWPAVLALTLVWWAGLLAHTHVLVAASPHLSHRRALTLNLTGSAISNVVPLGGAAGMELNRRMMRVWGIETASFAGFTFLTNLWDIASKFLLPVLAILLLARAGYPVIDSLQWAAWGAGVGFVMVVGCAVLVLRSPKATVVVGIGLERLLGAGARLIRRPRTFAIVTALEEMRRECLDVVRAGWFRMSAGMTGYLLLQGLLLWLCMDLTHSGLTMVAVVVGFAVERLLTVLPLTPGGVGVADLGLVGVLIALGGDPTGVAAGAILYRVFVFLIEIPIGGGALGLWLLDRWWRGRRIVPPVRVLSATPRVGHVTDVFLPRLGGIETHVDDLVRHQRAAGRRADVITATAATNGADPDPGWVRRVSVRQACRLVGEYDVLHVHVSLISPFGLAVVLAALRERVPVLITVHSMWSGRGVLVRLLGLVMFRRWPVVWSAVSGAAAEVFEKALGDVPVAVLADAVDVQDWGPAPGSAPRSATGPITFVSVMRLAGRKRPMALVRAFDRACALVPDRELRLVLVGDGALRGRVQRLVARRGLGERVTVTGRLPREEVRTWLLKSSVYVAPAPKEAFGIAALEARCVGLPVVASRGSGVREFVQDRLDGLLVSGDDEMVAALVELASDDELRERLSRHSRGSRPPFDWSDALIRTEDLYRAAALRMRSGTNTPPRPRDAAEPATLLLREA